jgi:hypothetical protein
VRTASPTRRSDHREDQATGGDRRQNRGDVGRRGHDQPDGVAALDDLWPILTPQTLLAELYTSPERLRAAGADAALYRADGDAWTVPDVPLLDELVDLLGRDKPADDTAERERMAEAEYAAGVLDLLISRGERLGQAESLDQLTGNVVYPAAECNGESFARLAEFHGASATEDDGKQDLQCPQQGIHQ